MATNKKINIQQEWNTGYYRWRMEEKWKTKTKRWKKKPWEDDEGVVTTGRRGRSRHSYLGRPGHRCWWRTWSWGWGCCRPRCGTWRAWTRSGAPCSPRCSGTSSGTGSEPRRCRGDRAGWRTGCRRTLCPRSSLWSGGLEGTCVERRRETLEKLADETKAEFYRALEPALTEYKIRPSGVCTSCIRFKAMLFEGYTMSTVPWEET